MPSGGGRDLAAIEKARRLIRECAKLAADRKDATGDQRHFEYLLALAALECGEGYHRHREAGKALDRADKVVQSYRERVNNSSGGGGSGGGFSPWVGLRRSSMDLVPSAGPAPPEILRQQLLAARGELCHAEGKPEEAVERWTEAVIGCGDRMDVGAVKTSLSGLKDMAADGKGSCFSDELLVALGLPTGSSSTSGAQQAQDVHDELASAVDAAILRLEGEAMLVGNVAADGGGGLSTTNVDLCFVMDCTQSVRGREPKREIEEMYDGR